MSSDARLLELLEQFASLLHCVVDKLEREARDDAALVDRIVAKLRDAGYEPYVVEVP